MALQIKRRMKAAQIAFKTGRTETDDEHADREDAERRRAAAKHLKTLIVRSPMNAWFPSDQSGPGWVPSWFMKEK